MHLFRLAIQLLKFKMDTRNHRHVYRSYLFPNHPALVSKLSTVFHVSSVLLWASLRWRPLFSGAAMACTCGIGTWFILAKLMLGWGLPGGCSLGCVSYEREILMEYAQPDMQFWKNYQPYPLNYPLADTSRKKKSGMLHQNNFRY